MFHVSDIIIRISLRKYILVTRDRAVFIMPAEAAGLIDVTALQKELQIIGWGEL